MKVNTKVFGEVDIEESKILHFPHGIIGFPELTEFALIHDSEKEGVCAVRWLQSMQEPAFAMPVMDPLAVKTDYNPEVEDELLKPLGVLNPEEILVLVTLSVPKEVTKMSVNLQAPIIVNAEEKKIKRKRDFGKSPFVVAVLDGKIVGFCRYCYEVISNDSKGFDSEIMALYVMPNLKGQGIGKKLFTYVKEDLLEHNKKQMVLWCLKDNMPSRGFYEKMGGKIIAEHGIEIGGKIYPEVGFGYDLLD